MTKTLALRPDPIVHRAVAAALDLQTGTITLQCRRCDRAFDAHPPVSLGVLEQIYRQWQLGVTTFCPTCDPAQYRAVRRRRAAV